MIVTLPMCVDRYSDIRRVKLPKGMMCLDSSALNRYDLPIAWTLTSPHLPTRSTSHGVLAPLE